MDKIDITTKTVFIVLFLYKVPFILFHSVSIKLDFDDVSKSIFFYETLLHFACKLGNLDIVKYIISLDKIDVSQKAVYLYFFNKVFLKKKFIIFQFIEF